MAVEIEINGTRYTAVNAAEESTLQRIANILEKSGGKTSGTTKNVDAAAKKTSDTLGVLSRETDKTTTSTKKSGDSLGLFEKQSKSATEGIKKFGAGLAGSLAQGAKGLFSAQTAGQALEGATNAASGALSMIPFVGGALGAAFGALAGQVTATFTAFEEITKSSSGFGFSMLAMRDAANTSGITLGQFTDIMKESQEAMSRFGGGTREGTKIFSNSMNNLLYKNRDLSQQLVRMGMNYKDQGVAMADYIGQMAALGANVNNMDVDKVSTEMVKLTTTTKALAQYNGINADMMKKEIEAKQRDAKMRAALSGLPAEMQQAGLAMSAQLSKNFGPVGDQLLKEIMVHGTAVSAETSLFAQSNAEAFALISNMAGQLKSGSADLAEIPNQIAALDPEKQQAAAADMAQAVGLTIGTSVSNAYTNMAEQTLIPQLDTAGKAVNQTMNNIVEDFKKLKEPADYLTQLSMSLTDIIQKFKTVLETVTTNILKLFGEEQGTLTKGIDEFGKWLTEVSKPENIKQMFEDFKKWINDVIAGWNNFRNSLLGQYLFGDTGPKVGPGSGSAEQLIEASGDDMGPSAAAGGVITAPDSGATFKNFTFHGKEFILNESQLSDIITSVLNQSKEDAAVFGNSVASNLAQEQMIIGTAVSNELLQAQETQASSSTTDYNNRSIEILENIHRVLEDNLNELRRVNQNI